MPGPICPLSEWVRNQTNQKKKQPDCIKAIGEYSVFCKYLTISLNQKRKQPLCASADFQNVIILRGLFLELVVYPDRLKRKGIDKKIIIFFPRIVNMKLF